MLIIPFLGQLDLGLVDFPLCVVGIVYITNVWSTSPMAWTVCAVR